MAISKIKVEGVIHELETNITNINGLQEILNTKADLSHNHDDSYDAKGAADTALSSAKTYADNAAATVKNDLLNGAGTAYDTLKELGELIDENVDAIEALETVAAGKADASHIHTVANISDLTATATELNYMNGVTSNVQTQLDGKAASSHGTHVTWSTTTPKANGTATVGSETKVARGDHVHPLQTSVSGNAGTATKLATARTISLNGIVSGSTTFDGSGNATITTTDGQHISNKNSGAYYFPLATMVTDDSGNYGNITIIGRIGGWEQSNSAHFNIMMLNRSSARDGNTITATVSASGEVEVALTKCDIVVYKSASDTSNTVYLKTSGYWLYDFDWSTYQHSIVYDGSKSADTPAGTLIWSLSTAPKTILDVSGNFSATGGIVSFGRKAGSTIGNPSVALGKDTEASNLATTAIGTITKATGEYATAVGYNCTASGQQSTAIGTSAQATGKKSISLGCNNIASNEYAFATGCWTTAKGIASTALGNGSSANGWTALASGIVTTAKGNAQHVFGSYNIVDDTLTDAQLIDDYSLKGKYLIIVGNGSSSAKSNAHTLDWNGNAWFAGDVTDGNGNTISNHWHSGFTGGSCELNIQGKLYNYGGFIDFHYHDADGNPTNVSGTVVDKTPDYTSRIIEDAPGVLNINGVSVKSTDKSVECNSLILKSSTSGSTKKFRVTIDDNGAFSATVI